MVSAPVRHLHRKVLACAQFSCMVACRWHLAGVLVATSGISLVALDNSGDSSDCTPEYGCLDDYAPGIIAALVSGLANAGKMVMAHSLLLGAKNKTDARVRVAEISTWNCLVPSLLLWIPLLATNEQQQYLDVLGPISSSDTHTLFVLLCVGLALGKMVDRLTKYGMVRLKGALFASMVDAIKKVLTAIVSIFVLGEAWSWSRGVSLALVFVAMGLYSYGSYLKAKASKAAALEKKLKRLQEDESRDNSVFEPRASNSVVGTVVNINDMADDPAMLSPWMAASPLDQITHNALQRRWSFDDATPDHHQLHRMRQRLGPLSPVLDSRSLHPVLSAPTPGKQVDMFPLPPAEEAHGQPEDVPKATNRVISYSSACSSPEGSVLSISSAHTPRRESPHRGGLSPQSRRTRTSAVGLWYDGLAEFALAASNDSDDAESDDEALALHSARSQAVPPSTPVSPLMSARPLRNTHSSSFVAESAPGSPAAAQALGAASPQMVSLRLDFTEKVESAADRFVANSSQASVLSASTKHSSSYV